MIHNRVEVLEIKILIEICVKLNVRLELANSFRGLARRECGDDGAALVTLCTTALAFDEPTTKAHPRSAQTYGVKKWYARARCACAHTSQGLSALRHEAHRPRPTARLEVYDMTRFAHEWPGTWLISQRSATLLTLLVVPGTAKRYQKLYERFVRVILPQRISPDDSRLHQLFSNFRPKPLFVPFS